MKILAVLSVLLALLVGLEAFVVPEDGVAEEVIMFTYIILTYSANIQRYFQRNVIVVPIKCPPGYAPDKFGKCRPIWGYAVEKLITDDANELEKILCESFDC